jgi:hypothetical protein
MWSAAVAGRSPPLLFFLYLVSPSIFNPKEEKLMRRQPPGNRRTPK